MSITAERLAQLESFLNEMPQGEGIPKIFVKNDEGKDTFVWGLKKRNFPKNLEGRVAWCWYNIYMSREFIRGLWEDADPIVAKKKKADEIRKMLAALEAEIEAETEDDN